MRIFGILFLGIILTISCKNTASDSTSDEIKKYQKEYESNKNSITGSKLINSIIQFVQNHPENLETNLSLFEKALEVSKEQNNLVQATGFLNTLIKEDPKHSETKERIKELTRMLIQLKNIPAGESIFLAFREKYPDESVDQLQVNTSDQNIFDRITRLSGEMFDDSTHAYREDIATQFVDACEAFVLVNPDHQEATNYLHKAGETARSIKSYRKALSIYDWIVQKYPKDDRAGQALFLQAFTYDNDLKNYDQAEELYKTFLAKYPEDEFADDAQFLLKNLGKSDEEILRELTGQQ